MWSPNVTTGRGALKSSLSSSHLGCDHLYSGTLLTVSNADKIRIILAANFLLELEKSENVQLRYIVTRVCNTLGDDRLFGKEECIIIFVL